MNIPPWTPALLFCAIFIGLAVASWQFARRWTPSPALAGIDAILIFLCVSYAVVITAGSLRILGTVSLAVLTCAAIFALFACARRIAGAVSPVPISRLGRMAVALVVAVLLTALWLFRWTPPSANDSLIYHLPAAVQWLQDGSLTRFETWGHNPANTWSPLGASALAAWSMGLLGNDFAARFIQVPGFLLLGAAVWHIARSMGASSWVALLLSLGVSCSRPMIAQLPIAKDDLLTAGLFAAAIAGLTPAALTTRGSAIRFGCAMGLLIGMKYPALYMVIPLLLAVDAPWRAGRRVGWYAIALGVAALLGGHWYLRNLIETGNPAFPFSILGMPGLMRSVPAIELRSWEGIVRTLTGTFFSVPPALFWTAVAIWAFRCITRMREVGEPLTRLILLGPPVMIAIFVLSSPFAEFRFVSGVLVLFAAAAAMQSSPLKHPGTRDHWAAIFATAFVVLALATAYSFVQFRGLLILVPLATACALVALFRRPVWLDRAVLAMAALGGLGLLYVFHGWAWVMYQGHVGVQWELPYGPIAGGWQFVRSEFPHGLKIAYTGTEYVYPLQGRTFEHRVVYVSPLAHRPQLIDFPPLGPVSGSAVNDVVRKTLTESVDRATWRQRVVDQGIQLLLVGRGWDAPEARWAAEEPNVFVKIFENDGAVIYEVVNP